ncbi:MAG TPA: hypothetical protein VLA20_09170 [Vicinamibacterales bacterium]|nr:hypothetical protein [Vicinamibacterales bacterium]
MESSRFVVAVLAGGVTAFLTGFVLWGMLAGSFFEANQTAGLMLETPRFVYLIVGQLAFAVILTVIIAKWARVGGAGQGLQIGAITGLLVAIGVDFTMYGTSDIMNLTATLVDPILVAVHMGVTGAVIGAVLGGQRAR